MSRLSYLYAPYCVHSISQIRTPYSVQEWRNNRVNPVTPSLDASLLHCWQFQELFAAGVQAARPPPYAPLELIARS